MNLAAKELKDLEFYGPIEMDVNKVATFFSKFYVNYATYAWIDE
jgi:hypothetical protein